MKTEKLKPSEYVLQGLEQGKTAEAIANDLKQKFGNTTTKANKTGEVIENGQSNTHNERRKS